jgi:tetratricopeptide (TPR) repeat protein
MHDYRHAAETLQRALALSPDNTRLQRGLAADLLFSNQLDEALKLYQQIGAEETRDPEPAFRMAQIYRSKRNFAEARKSLDRAKSLSTDTDNLEIRYEEVNLLEAEGKNTEAIAALKALIDETAKKSYTASESSNRAMLLERLGILYRNNSQYPQAIDAFRQAGALDGDGAPRLAVQVIDTWRSAKDLDAAQREADAALKKYPNERMVALEHANVLADRGKIDDAAAEVRKQLKGGGESQDRETLLTLAQIYEKGKRFTDMSKTLDEAEKLCTSNDDKESVVFMRGAMFERQKKFDAAEAEFRKVLGWNPNNASALNYLGYMLADRDMRLDEASTLIRKALNLDPDNGAYLDSLGWVYYRQGKLPEAEGVLVRALERLDSDPTVHEHLGDVYSKQGKTREAIAQWQAALKGYQAGNSAENEPEAIPKVSKKLETARVRLAQEKK